MTLEEPEGPSRIRDDVIIRLTVYYTVVFGLFVGLLSIPGVGDLISGERARQLGIIPQDPTDLTADPSLVLAPLQVDTVIPVALGMLGALLLALPVAWVYLWTRPPQPYRSGIAQTVVVLPIAIALVVFLVKGSLPLAFSLAGIVAAIRWRTSLSETMDAVFMFIAIGIGLAAGVQFLMVALVASLAFNAVALTIWRLDFAGQAVTLHGWQLRRGAAMKAAPTGETSHETVLRIHASDLAGALEKADAILSTHAKEWSVTGTIDEKGGASLAELTVRLKKRSDPDILVRLLEKLGAPQIEQVDR
jgi:hypothetical protein